MSKKAKEFLAERGIANNEMIEGAYGSAYYLSGMLETFTYQETKAKDNEIERLNEMLENRSKFINELRESTNQRIKELEEGLRTLYNWGDYAYSEEIEQLLNQNKDEGV